MGRRWVLVVGAVACGCGVSEASLEEDFREPETGFLLFDGDLPVASGAEAGAMGAADSVSVSQGLTVARVDGHDDLWPRAVRQRLTWCLDRKSFGRDAPAVLEAMRVATADWESAANVHFVHLSTEDTRCSRWNAQVLFDVRRVSGRPYLARAFLPGQGRAAREVLVDDTALPPRRPLSVAGVLRHELGHALGLRHEHTRSRSNPCFEDAAWRAVTAYDVRSVMHYPQCAGVAGRDLVLTATDRRGIAALYP